MSSLKNSKWMFASIIVAALFAGAIAAPELRAFAAAVIGSADIIDESILSADIKNGEVKNSELATDAVTGSKIQNLSIKTSDLGDGIVTSGKIKDGTIQKHDLSSTIAIPSGVTKLYIGECFTALSALANGEGNATCPTPLGVIEHDDLILGTISTDPAIYVTSYEPGDSCADDFTDGNPCDNFEILYINLGDTALDDVPAWVKFIAFK